MYTTLEVEHGDKYERHTVSFDRHVGSTLLLNVNLLC